MNNGRRKVIQKAVDILTNLKTEIESKIENNSEPTLETTTLGRLNGAKLAFENARDEEQEYLDNMPEAIADGDKGDTAQEDIDYLDNAATYAGEAVNMIENPDSGGIDLTDLADKIGEAIDEAGNIS